MIVRNAFGHTGLGVPVQRALVVGSDLPAGREGESRHQYTFLWILDPKDLHSKGIGNRYHVELRQSMNDLFRLVKSEVVFDELDVEAMESSMGNAPEDFSGVQFVEEFFYSEEIPTRVDRRYLYNAPAMDAVAGNTNMMPSASLRRDKTVIKRRNESLAPQQVHDNEFMEQTTSTSDVVPCVEAKGNANFVAEAVKLPKRLTTLVRPVSMMRVPELAEEDDIAG